MSVKRTDYLTAYNAVEVPAPAVFSEAENDVLDKTTDDFFYAIQESIALNEASLDAFFERTFRKFSENKSDTYYPVETGERVETFRRIGGQVIASVCRISDEPGLLTVRFAKYRLLDKTDQEICDFQLLERITDGLELS